jgi:hypothetical protein
MHYVVQRLFAQYAVVTRLEVFPELSQLRSDLHNVYNPY